MSDEERAMDVGVRNGSALSYIRGLDGLRAISVLWVIAFHYLSYFRKELAALPLSSSMLRNALSEGWVGVDIFLVISGFLITKIILKDPVQTVSYAHFMRRRAWRLLPAYILVLATFTATALIIDPSSKVMGNSWSLWTLTSNLLLSFGDRTALMDDHFAMYHLWSVAIEWHFYAIMPFVIRKFQTPQRAAAVLIVAAIACRTAFHFLEASDNAIYAFSLCRIDAFSIGALVAVARPLATPGRMMVIGAVGAGCFALILSSIAISNEPFKAIVWVQTAGYTLIDAAIGLVVFFVVHANAASLPIRLLESLPLRSIGRASYSLYLWHIPFFPLLVLFARDRFQDSIAAFWFSSISGLAFTALAGTLSYWFVERRYMASRASRTDAVAAAG